MRVQQTRQNFVHGHATLEGERGGGGGGGGDMKCFVRAYGYGVPVVKRYII